MQMGAEAVALCVRPRTPLFPAIGPLLRPRETSPSKGLDFQVKDSPQPLALGAPS